MVRALLALMVMAGLAFAQGGPEQDPPERAFVLTLEWSDAGVEIKSKDRREMAVPEQNGMPLLKPFYFVIEDGEKNVHYAGGLTDPRERMGEGGKPVGTATSRIVVPELDDARHFVIYRRTALDLKAGKKVVAETDL